MSTSYKFKDTDQSTSYSVSGIDTTTSYTTSNIGPSSTYTLTTVKNTTQFLQFTNFFWDSQFSYWNDITTIWGSN